MKRLLAGLLLGTILGLACSADADSPDKSRVTDFSSTNESLSGGQVEMQGFHYNCIVYTKVDRGGLWCDRISAP